MLFAEEVESMASAMGLHEMLLSNLANAAKVVSAKELIGFLDDIDEHLFEQLVGAAVGDFDYDKSDKELGEELRAIWERRQKRNDK